MKFALSLRNVRTELFEIEHSVMSVTGVSRILGVICGCDNEQLAAVLEAVINGRHRIFTFGDIDDLVAKKWEVNIQVIE